MKMYIIDYTHGIARMTCPETSEPLTMFYRLASGCFGIRKSIENPVVGSMEDVPDLVKGNASLKFGGDSYIFNTNLTHNNYPWKLSNAWGDECTCKRVGIPDEECTIHGGNQ